MIARLIVALCLGLAVSTSQAHDLKTADQVVINKGERQLHLMRRGAVWRSYPIGLGFAPEGHKQREGDGRTPEGDYILDWRPGQKRIAFRPAATFSSTVIRPILAKCVIGPWAASR
jgi:murein L,D-transpeptidase YafK